MYRLVALLMAIGLVTLACVPEPPPEPVDCTRRGPGVDLHDCDLSGLDLTGVNLSGANLRRANLSYSVLNEANLTAVDAVDANFFGATMGEWGAYDDPVIGPILNSANLTNADLRTTLFNVDLDNANMTGARLTYLDFSSGFNVKMVNARWHGSIYQGGVSGDLSGIDMTGTEISRSTVSGNMTGATLRNLVFEGDGWISGNFTNADLTGAGGTDYNWDIEGSIWSNTTCPNGVLQSTPCFAPAN